MNRALFLAAVLTACLAGQEHLGRAPHELGPRPVHDLSLENVRGAKLRARSLDQAGSASAALWRGIDAMYSYSFAEAATALDLAMDLDPEDPVAPFVAVANTWLRAQTESGVAESYEALDLAVQAVIPRYDSLLARYGRRADILLFMGSSYGLVARVALAEKRWLSVLFSGYRGLRLVQEAQRADSTLTDVYLGLGVFSYYAGISSRPIRLVAPLFGIRPDRHLGLRQLRRTVHEGTYAWIEAASTLAITYLYIEDDPEQALGYAQFLMDRYPENHYFNFLLGEALVRTGRLTEARRFLPGLTAMMDRAHPQQRLEWALKHATLEAALAFAEGDFVAAESKSQWVVENYAMEFDWHLGIAYYLRGRLRQQRGDQAGARKDYQSAVALENKTYVMERARAALDQLETADGKLR